MSENKYQEALDRRKEAFENMFNVLEMEKDNKFYEDIELLQELVDKATAKKIVYINNGITNLPVSQCPNCGIVDVFLENFNYCHNCGQRLDFSEEEE